MTRSLSSGRIEDLEVAEYRAAAIRVHQRLPFDQVNGAAEDPGKLVTEFGQVEKVPRRAFIKGHQDVHVAFGCGLAVRHRAEKRQLPDAPLAADRGDDRI